MKNKKFIKFLGFLISSLIVLNSSGQIFAKKVTKVKNIKQKEIQKSNAEIFKNFNENNFKVEGFNLTVYFKNDAPILYYEHIKTKAKIVVIPTEETNLIDTFNFNLFVPNEKGLSNFTEKAIISNFKRKDLKIDGKFRKFSPIVHLNRFNPILDISYWNNQNEKEFLKEFLSGLKNPKMLKDERVFNLEKKRILNEITHEEETSAKEKTGSFNILGKSSEIKKVTKKEFEEFFKSRVHPSNLFVTKHLSLKNPLKVKEFLEILNENYLKYFEFKEIKNTPYEFKREIFNIIPKSYTEFNEKYKYCATAEFFNDSDEEDLKLAMKHPLIRNLLLHYDYNHLNEKLKKSLKEFAKKLGYSNIELINQFNFQIAGNNKNLFEKNTLRKNCRKIYNFILEKIINKTYDELKKSIYNTFSKKKGSFKSPEYFEFKLNLEKILIQNFKLFKEPFSKNCFKINEKNKIEDSEETLLEELKKDIKNLNELKNKKELKIDLYSINKKEKPVKKEKFVGNYIPIKITKNNGNYGLELLAKKFLIENCLNEKLDEEALITFPSFATNFFGRYIGICSSSSTKKMLKEEMKFYETEFEDFIKNYNITKKEFEEVKENVKKNVFYEDKERLRVKKIIENVTKKFEELLSKEANPKITYHSFLEEIAKIQDPPRFGSSFIMFKSFEEYLEHEKRIKDFVLKYRNLLKTNKDFKMNKDFIKDYYEYLVKPTIKETEQFFKIMKNLKNNINSISFKDFVNCVKSAKLVEKKQFEKDKKLERELNSNFPASSLTLFVLNAYM